jgi:tRNA1Val (adenine37-N6)-methyltransferase
LPFAALLQQAATLIADDGIFSLILPREGAQHMIRLGKEQGWYLAQHCEVQSSTDKPVQRVLFSLSRQPQTTSYTSLSIHQASGSYSADYKALLRDFYLKF